MNSVVHSRALWGPSHATQPRLHPRCSAQPDSGEERVFACDLPTPKEEDPVYACLLPEPSPPSRPWQFWRRRVAPPARPAPPQAEDELSRLSTSRARWEDQRARLQTVAECFRTADLARACGDFETASRLREYAAQWALLGTSGNSDSEASRAAAPLSRDVVIEIRQLGGGIREVWAAVEVAAPAELVWRTLTDYERLAGTARLCSRFVAAGDLTGVLWRRHCALPGGEPGARTLARRRPTAAGEALVPPPPLARFLMSSRSRCRLPPRTWPSASSSAQPRRWTSRSCRTASLLRGQCRSWLRKGAHLCPWCRGRM